MDHNRQNLPVECTLDESEREQPSHLEPALFESYDRLVEHDDGYTYIFEGAADTLQAVSTFVGGERQCCSFAEYTITVAPPYDETRLTIRGPEGTKAQFERFEKLLSADGEAERRGILEGEPTGDGNHV